MSRTYRKPRWPHVEYSVESYVKKWKYFYRCWEYIRDDEGKIQGYRVFIREQDENNLRKEYDKYSRDGKWNESGRKQGFKKDCKKVNRNKSKAAINKILKDPEAWEDVEWPVRKDGKAFR